jgi:hypothetical protein
MNISGEHTVSHSRVKEKAKQETARGRQQAEKTTFRKPAGDIGKTVNLKCSEQTKRMEKGNPVALKRCIFFLLREMGTRERHVCKRNSISILSLAMWSMYLGLVKRKLVLWSWMQGFKLMLCITTTDLSE